MSDLQNIYILDVETGAILENKTTKPHLIHALSKFQTPLYFKNLLMTFKNKCPKEQSKRIIPISDLITMRNVDFTTVASEVNSTAKIEILE